MNTWIALFRGINVGGNNRLTMQELVTLLEGLGLQRVATYVQSGNAVFDADKGDARGWEKRIAAAVLARHGFEPRVLLIDAKALAAAVTANPYPQADTAHKSLHLFFLAAAPADAATGGAAQRKLDALRANGERFTLKDKVFYLHAPDGVGNSKLAARAEKLLGVDATARNWRTVNEVLRLCASRGPSASTPARPPRPAPKPTAKARARSLRKKKSSKR
jgi:uncharacterized protein (DUF1697 family)